MSLYYSIRSNNIYQGEAAMDQEELDQAYIDSGEWELELDD